MDPEAIQSIEGYDHILLVRNCTTVTKLISEFNCKNLFLKSTHYYYYYNTLVLLYNT